MDASNIPPVRITPEVGFASDFRKRDRSSAAGVFCGMLARLRETDRDQWGSLRPVKVYARSPVPKCEEPRVSSSVVWKPVRTVATRQLQNTRRLAQRASLRPQRPAVSFQEKGYRFPRSSRKIHGKAMTISSAGTGNREISGEGIPRRNRAVVELVPRR